MKRSLTFLLLLANSLLGQDAPFLEWRLLLGDGQRQHAMPEGVAEVPSGGWIMAFRYSFPTQTSLGTRVVRVSACGRQEWAVDLPSLGTPSPMQWGDDGLAHLFGVKDDQLVRLAFDERGAWKKEADLGPVLSFRAFPTRGGGWMLFRRDREDEVAAVKLGPRFDEAWRSVVPNLHYISKLQSFVETEDGGYLALEAAHAIRLSASGEARWQKRLAREEGDVLTKAVSVTGGVVIAGTSKRGGERGSKFGEADSWCFKLDHQGDLAWETIVGGDLNEFSKDLVAQPDGGVIAFFGSDSASFRASGGDQQWKRPGALLATRLNPAGRVEALASIARTSLLPSSAAPVAAHSSPGGGAWLALGISSQSLADPSCAFSMLDDRLRRPWSHEIPACRPDGARGDRRECVRFVDFSVMPVRSGALVFARHTWPPKMSLYKIIGSGASVSTCGPFLAPTLGRTPQGAWTLLTRLGWRYELEASPNLVPGTWSRLVSVTGDGLPFTFPGRTQVNAAQEFFRVRVEAP